MRTALANGVIVALIVAGSVVMAGVASTLALERPDLEELDANLDSRISADYSPDERIRFAPLDEAVIDVAQGDGTQGTPDEVEIVEPFRLDPPADAGDEPSPSPTPTPTPTPAASETPQPTVSPASSLPATGTFTPKPTPTPTPTPGPNITPAPTVPSVRTPTPTPTPTPAPTPKAMGLYLHNNPSPPTGNTSSHAVLPMETSAPSVTTLYNYDTDRDSAPGIVIAQGNLGPGETDTAKYQTWRSPAFSSDVVLVNAVTVRLWTAMKDFDATKQGSIRVYLQDFNGSTYSTIAGAQVTRSNTSATWQELTVSLSSPGYKIAAGHQIELKVTVNSSLTEDDVWFAYDTTAYPARIETTVLEQ